MASVLFSRTVEIEEGEKNGVPNGYHYCQHEYYVCSVKDPRYRCFLLEEEIRQHVHYKSRNQKQYAAAKASFGKEGEPFRPDQLYVVS